MEEEKKVFIRGCKGRGSEVIDILKGLRATNECDTVCYATGEDEDSIYFISHKNKITCVLIGSEVANIIMDNYKEIKLPQRQWKEGDILINEYYPFCSVFKSFKSNDTFETYFTLLQDKTVSFDTSSPVGHYHLASAEEMRKIPKLFYVLLNNLDALRKCLPKKESEE